MRAFLAQLSYRAKAVAAGVAGGVGAYVQAAVDDNTLVTLQGLEQAAVVAFLLGLLVHTVPRGEAPAKPKRRRRKSART